jgi:rubrerythrin
MKNRQKRGKMMFDFNADEVFRMAMDIEENGRVFYEKAAQLIEDAQVKKIFGELARAEAEHYQFFASLRKKLPEAARKETIYDPQEDLHQYLTMMAGQHVFQKKKSVEQYLAQVRSAVDAINLALGFEKDSIVFYLTMKGRTEAGSGRNQIDALVNEELIHHRRLSLELLRLMS